VRKVILGLGISLDGYIARRNGAVDFLFMPKDYSDSSFGQFFRTIDTAIMGRKTYDIAQKMGGASYGPKIATYVCSRKRTAGERDGVTFTRQSPAGLVRRLRQRDGKHIWLIGGGELAREFLKADLVDELYIGIVPILLGEGIPLFPSGFPQRNFVLVENETFSKGLVALKYRRAGSQKAKKKT
jgi:dihydrofolate reductase